MNSRIYRLIFAWDKIQQSREIVKEYIILFKLWLKFRTHKCQVRMAIDTLACISQILERHNTYFFIFWTLVLRQWVTSYLLFLLLSMIFICYICHCADKPPKLHFNCGAVIGNTFSKISACPFEKQPIRQQNPDWGWNNAEPSNLLKYNGKKFFFLNFKYI